MAQLQYLVDIPCGFINQVRFLFPDGAEFLMDVDGEWDYCTEKDRRFYSEIKDGLQPAGL